MSRGDETWLLSGRGLVVGKVDQVIRRCGNARIRRCAKDVSFQAPVVGLDLSEMISCTHLVIAETPTRLSPGDLLKLYIYSYLSRVRSSRRLEAETTRNLIIM